MSCTILPLTSAVIVAVIVMLVEEVVFSPALEGEVTKDTGFWSPVGDSPLGNGSPKVGSRSVAGGSLVSLARLSVLCPSVSTRGSHGLMHAASP